MARPRTFDEDIILQKVAELFWKKGYNDTSIGDLEDATGLKRTSLYAAFQDKQRLYESALNHYQKQTTSIASEYFEDTINPVTSLKQLITDSVLRAHADPDKKGCFFNNACVERAGQCPSTTDFVHNNRRSVIHSFQQQIERAIEAELLPGTTDSYQVAHYLFTLYSGLMVDVKNGSKEEELLNAIELGFSFLFK